MVNPAFLFWATGLGLHGYSEGFDQLVELIESADFPVLLLMAAGAFVVVSASSAAVDAVLPYVLRLLEGYWPNRLRGLREWKADKARARFRHKRSRWRELARRHADLNDAERDEYRSLDDALRAYPDRTPLVLPTRLGNILAAAEHYSARRYGLSAVIMWPRLWFTTPDHVRQEIGAARGSLDSAVRGFLWSGFLLVWLVFSWWVIPLSLFGCLLAYMRMLATSATYGELVKSAFDTFHRDLFLQIGWIESRAAPLEFPKAGEELTVFVRRGPEAM